MQAFGLWYSGAASTSIYIDHRGPNGDDTMTWSQCTKW